MSRSVLHDALRVVRRSLKRRWGRTFLADLWESATEGVRARSTRESEERRATSKLFGAGGWVMSTTSARRARRTAMDRVETRSRLFVRVDMDAKKTRSFATSHLASHHHHPRASSCVLLWTFCLSPFALHLRICSIGYVCCIGATY